MYEVVVVVFRLYKQSIELSGMSPRGGALPGMEVGGSMALGAGSTFSESSILSSVASQLMWKRVTRGLDAKMFLCSCESAQKKKKSKIAIIRIVWTLISQRYIVKTRC